MNSNYVDINDVVEIKDNQVVIVGSRECNEIMVLIPSSDAFGFGALISKEYDMKSVKSSLKRMGISDEIVELNLNGNGETYVCREGFEGGKTICVKELEEDGEMSLKLCVVLTKGKRAKVEEYMDR